jgi:hypothetical protein
MDFPLSLGDIPYIPHIGIEVSEQWGVPDPPNHPSHDLVLIEGILKATGDCGVPMT